MHDYKSAIPAGVSGEWRVEKFTVTPENESWERVRAIAGCGGRFVTAGNYTRLLHRGNIVMSDTPDELRDMSIFLRHATGLVLINGLGLGVALEQALGKREVFHVTVIEQSADVMALVAPYFRQNYGGRVEIICADAFTWQPPKGSRYNTVWHDIWADITTDNLPGMSRLHRKYGHRADWQGSWCRERCQWMRKQDQRRGWW